MAVAVCLARSFPLAEEAAPIAIHVSTQGLDTNNGSLPNDGTGADGPVRTLERARLLVHALREEPSNASRPVEVRIAPGTYELNSPLVLGPQDSGELGAPVIYRGASAELVHISGGRALAEWMVDSQWGASVPLDGSTSDRGCPTQLFVSGKRRERPRLPEEGTFAIGAVPAPGADRRPVVSYFFAKPGDFPTTFHPASSTEIVVFDAWTASRMRVSSFDAITGRLDLQGAFAGHGHSRNFTVDLPFYIENPPVDRLAPGTWRCDPTSSMMYYRPLPGEMLDQLTAVVPRVPRLVVLRGKPEAPVHDIAFEDLTFEYSSWTLPPNGWAAMQAEVGLGAAIEMESCRSIAIRRAAVRHTGASAIRIGRNCVDIELSESTLTDLGGTGVAIGSDQRYPSAGSDWEGGTVGHAETHHIRILDNEIAQLGRIHAAATGIWSGQAHHVQIERNHIRDLYYSGISIGWVWNTGPSLSHDNVVSGNVIEDFGQGVLSDFGGIYTLGRQESSVVSDNFISGGIARTYGGHGLYADAGTAGIVFQNNVIRRTSQAAIHVQRGADLIFHGNVADDYGEAGIRCNQPSEGQSVVFRRNVFKKPSVPRTHISCAHGSYAFEDNVFMRKERVEVISKPFDLSTFFEVTDSP